MISRRWAAVLSAFVLLAAGAAGRAADAARSVVPEKHPLARLIDVSVRVTPQKVQPGGVVQLVIEGRPKPDCYTYPFTKTSTSQVGMPPRVKISSPDFEALYPVAEQASTKWKYHEDGANLVITDPFTWTIDVLVAPSAKPGTRTLDFTLAMQVCDKSGCTPGTLSLSESLTIEGSAVTPSPATQGRPRTPPEQEAITPPPADVGDGNQEGGLWKFIAAAAAAAVLMLLTPCVFPMIPITVSFFLKQSEKEHHNPLPMALVYSLTIIIVLTLAVLAVGSLIVKWANDPWLNLGLGAVLIFFSLSLFGMYEIEMPHFLSNWTSSRQGQGGLLGTIFMALTFTITSFTCTGPFLGPLLASATALRISYTHLVLGALTYSTVFASPFFVLALFPALLRRLPKSGGWMNNIKVVMGFLELAAALKFLAITDNALFPGDPKLFNYDTVLAAWIGLSALCGIYLLGFIQLPHDSPVESLSVPRLLFASLFFGLAVYMVPALNRETPLGTIGSGIVAFLPLDTAPKEAEFTYDLQEAWDEAVREDKLIFIDFTGVNCTNCRSNEKNVFPRPKVEKELKKFVKVQLYTDVVPDPDLSKSDAEKHAERNLELQRNTFEDVTNPFYVVIRPDRNKKNAVENGRIQGEVLMKTKGLINDPKEFVQRLKDAQKRQGTIGSPSNGEATAKQ